MTGTLNKWLDEPVSDTQILRKHRLWLYVLCFFVMCFLVIPSFIVIPMSFSASQYLEFPPKEWSLRWYDHYIHHADWMRATATSFKVAILNIFVATPVGVMAAYGLYSAQFRFNKYIYLLLISPMIIPVVLIGIGIFYAYAKLKLVNTITGLVLAHTILALPLVIIVVTSALHSFDQNLEIAARSLGASRVRAFFSVTLPQIRFSVITAALLSFLTSFDEVIVALFISGGQNGTVTRRMFTSLRDQIDPTIASISTIMIIISCLLVAALQLLGKEKEPES